LGRAAGRHTALRPHAPSQVPGEGSAAASASHRSRAARHRGGLRGAAVVARVAYGSDDSGKDAIFVQPVPPTGSIFQISSGDVGHHALWSRDGKRLFYIPGPSRFSGVDITTQPSFAFSSPTSVPRAFTIGNAQVNQRNHDVAPDGRFLGRDRRRLRRDEHGQRTASGGRVELVY
jgi:hypothetical protein